MLAGADDAALAASLDEAVLETRRIVADLVEADDQAEVAAALGPRLRAIEAQVASVSDLVSRQYFALLPMKWTDGLVLEDAAS